MNVCNIYVDGGSVSLLSVFHSTKRGFCTYIYAVGVSCFIVTSIEIELLKNIFWWQQQELGTEYLVRPVGRAEDEEDASDFEPEENGEDEDIDEEDADDEDDGGTGGKVEAPPKRKRKDDSDDGGGGGGEDDERPSKR